MTAIVTNLFGREDQWTEDEMARVVRHFEQGGSPRTIAAILGKPLDLMETVFAALAAQREKDAEPEAVPHRSGDRRVAGARKRWGPPLAADLVTISYRIRRGILDAVNAYCRANPIQRREFIRRCLSLYLDWLDEDDAAEERFVREYGYATAAPRPYGRVDLSLQGDEPVQMSPALPRDLVEHLRDRCQKDNISQSELVDRALEWNLTMIEQDGEWVLFEDMVQAREQSDRNRADLKSGRLKASVR